MHQDTDRPGLGILDKEKLPQDGFRHWLAVLSPPWASASSVVPGELQHPLWEAPPSLVPKLRWQQAGCWPMALCGKVGAWLLCSLVRVGWSKVHTGWTDTSPGSHAWFPWLRSRCGAGLCWMLRDSGPRGSGQQGHGGSRPSPCSCLLLACLAGPLGAWSLFEEGRWGWLRGQGSGRRKPTGCRRVSFCIRKVWVNREPWARGPESCLWALALRSLPEG